MDVIDGKWIKAHLTGRHGEQAELAAHVRISQDKLAKILSGQRRVQATEIPLILSFFAGTQDGEGEVEPMDDGDHDLVPVYDVQASAGDGVVIYDEQAVAQLSFPPGYLAKLTAARPKDLKIISVKGDSMLPTLADDDVVMLDVSKKDLSYDGLFVIRDGGDALLVKRIGRASTAGRVSIISDNRAVYPTVERLLSEIDVVGRVIWRGGKL